MEFVYSKLNEKYGIILRRERTRHSSLELYKFIQEERLTDKFIFYQSFEELYCFGLEYLGGPFTNPYLAFKSNRTTDKLDISNKLIKLGNNGEYSYFKIKDEFEFFLRLQFQ